MGGFWKAPFLGVFVFAESRETAHGVLDEFGVGESTNTRRAHLVWPTGVHSNQEVQDDVSS